jgi:hypothetical protein
MMQKLWLLLRPIIWNGPFCGNRQKTQAEIMERETQGRAAARNGGYVNLDLNTGSPGLTASALFFTVFRLADLRIRLCFASIADYPSMYGIAATQNCAKPQGAASLRTDPSLHSR